jgi:CxxC motif-containing protein (DUF1111 family)
MPAHSLRGALIAASLIAPLCAQTGRSVSAAQPPRIGATARFDVAYPSAAIGNLGLLAITEHATGTTPFPVPGFTSFGAVRIAPAQVLVQMLFLPDASGTASTSLGIPLDAALVGFPFDVQSVDIDLVGNGLYWSDNDLEFAIEDNGCGSPLQTTPLYPIGTVLEPDVVVDSPTARITYLADRARDRHAREDIVNGIVFRKYDHWLPFYWEQRIAEIEITDRVARGGNSIDVRWMTHSPLNPAEFRTFFSGVPSVAVYHNNLATAPGTGVTLVSTTPSTRYPGETEYRYSATITQKIPEMRPLQIGDRMEVELSQFLGAPRNGRPNYYGTAFLYVVGEGVVPWYAKLKEEAPTPQQQQSASFDSFRLPDVAWLGGATTLPYQYSNEPLHRFKQMAGNIAPQSGHEFVLGRRLHHTDFGTGAHSEANNPAMQNHVGQLGPKFIAESCVACHVNNGRSLPPAIGEPLRGAVVHVAADPSGAPHPTLGETLQPSAPSGPAPIDVKIEAESFLVMSGVLVQPTTDVGGGSNVYAIDTGDWISFANTQVVFPTSGLYRFEFRVASAAGGGILAFEESGGAILHGTVPIPATGGPQSWQTITRDFTMTAGTHVFGMNAFAGGWNLNWFRVTTIPSGGGGGSANGEGLVRLDGYDFIQGTYGDGQAYQLRRPRYRFEGTAPTYYSVRNAPPLIGMGLLEAIDDATLLLRHDPCDSNGDGISGRISTSESLANGQLHVGRFTSKGTRASVRDQVAYALNRDMGVASALMPTLDGDASPSAPEVTQQELDRMTRYAALLGVSARRNLINPQALAGEQLFGAAGCAACHVPQLTTGTRHPFAEVRNQTIRPFTDLLLHDMGPGLADPMRDGNTNASEWRTSPLWNIGLTADVSGGEAYLHDGRARTLEEAILWHDGEGRAARDAFRTMPAADRAALVAFLRSL